MVQVIDLSRVALNNLTAIVSGLFDKNGAEVWNKHVITRVEQFQDPFEVAQDFFCSEQRDWDEGIRVDGLLDGSLDALVTHAWRV